MSEIKQVNMTIPIPVNKTRRGRKAKLPTQAEAPPPKPVFTPTIPVKQAAGAKNGLPPAVAPSLSTTTAVGGKKKNPLKIALPISKVQSTSPKAKSETPAVKIVPAKKQVPQTRKITPVNTKVKINPTKRKNQTLKLKFSAKKITIHVENAAKIRRTRESIEKQVANMSLEEITKSLRKRGMVRENANPPEAMQRSMMKDLLNFPTPL
jgi:hypothetical protein